MSCFNDHIYSVLQLFLTSLRFSTFRLVPLDPRFQRRPPREDFKWNLMNTNTRSVTVKMEYYLQDAAAREVTSQRTPAPYYSTRYHLPNQQPLTRFISIRKINRSLARETNSTYLYVSLQVGRHLRQAKIHASHLQHRVLLAVSAGPGREVLVHDQSGSGGSECNRVGHDGQDESHQQDSFHQPQAHVCEQEEISFHRWNWSNFESFARTHRRNRVHACRRRYVTGDPSIERILRELPAWSSRCGSFRNPVPMYCFRRNRGS